MRYIAGLLLGIGLIVLTFVLIFRALGGGGGSSERERQINLNDYATTNAVMRWTQDGAINSEERHARVRISVTKDQVTFEQIQGYQGKLVQTKTFPSNPQAYGTFLRALTLAGFTNARPNVTDDERGYCPQGRRFIYEIVNGGDEVKRTWSTSCSRDQGSFNGSADTVRSLFQKQVPDYDRIVSNIKFQ